MFTAVCPRDAVHAGSGGRKIACTSLGTAFDARLATRFHARLADSADRQAQRRWTLFKHATMLINGRVSGKTPLGWFITNRPPWGITHPHVNE